jgi:hypothetical protein
MELVRSIAASVASTEAAPTSLRGGVPEPASIGCTASVRRLENQTEAAQVP